MARNEYEQCFVINLPVNSSTFHTARVKCPRSELCVNVNKIHFSMLLPQTIIDEQKIKRPKKLCGAKFFAAGEIKQQKDVVAIIAHSSNLPLHHDASYLDKRASFVNKRIVNAL